MARLTVWERIQRLLHRDLYRRAALWTGAYCEPVTPDHSTQWVEGISGGAQKELSECQGGQQARGVRWQQVFGYEQVVSDVGHPETKIRYVYSLV